MKIKLDENLPATLAISLQQLGHDVETVPGEGLAGSPDSTIWANAQDELRFLITQDLDFSDMRQFVPGAHAGILLLRLRNPGRIALMQLVMRLFLNENVTTWSGCFVVATERKLRIHRTKPENR
jgi:predicted nuclease of predicted toxin-antitoxin system